MGLRDRKVSRLFIFELSSLNNQRSIRRRHIVVALSMVATDSVPTVVINTKAVPPLLLAKGFDVGSITIRGLVEFYRLYPCIIVIDSIKSPGCLGRLVIINYCNFNAIE